MITHTTATEMQKLNKAHCDGDTVEASVHYIINQLKKNLGKRYHTTVDFKNIPEGGPTPTNMECRFIRQALIDLGFHVEDSTVPTTMHVAYSIL